jgi:hypothetical protein
VSPLAKAKRAPDLTLILGPHHPMGDEQDDQEGDPEQAKTDAAQALIEAVKSGDASGVVEAIGALHDLCAAESDKDDEEGDEE